jgi:hypothetical protein
MGQVSGPEQNPIVTELAVLPTFAPRNLQNRPWTVEGHRRSFRARQASSQRPYTNGEGVLTKG